MATTFATVGDYVTECRRLLQDTITPYRYADDDVYRALNIALQQTRRLRADLFILQDDMRPPSYTSVNIAVVIPIEESFRQALIYFMTGWLQIADQEDVQDQRSAALLQKFSAQMLTVG